MTSLAEERAEQQRWTARLRRAPAPLYDRLVEHEFEAPEQHQVRLAHSLRAILRFAAREVPHYRAAFRRAKPADTDRDPIKVLERLPVLTKLEVQDAGETLLAKNLPPHEQRTEWWASSGTTGRPVRILHTARSAMFFLLAAQRGYRWHRLDPSGTLADMRLPRFLPLRADGRPLGAGETLRGQTWRYVADFVTGPYLGISALTPLEERIEWLRRERPDYLLAYSETLESLAMATGDERPADSLKGLIAVSEQLTPSMRRYIERRFGTPVHELYGLSEIGLVAVRCEAGRYHVHTEHCVVEILDEKGGACSPGETGRIIITGLSNFATPLIRYDTGDLALAVAGTCGCNRTLPSFGQIVGRYSRAAYLPQGTIGAVLALREAIENMPGELMRDFREFQIHQFADRRMELRMVTRAALPDTFYARLHAAWAEATQESGFELSFRSVREIPRAPGGKSEVFTSDFMPARNDNPPAALPSTGDLSDEHA